MIRVAHGHRAVRRLTYSLNLANLPEGIMGAWTIGHNRPGYLPDTVQPAPAYADRDEAVSALVAEMEEYADDDDEAAREDLAATADLSDYPDYELDGYGDDEPVMRAIVDAILADDGPNTLTGDWSAWAADRDGVRVSFWLAWSDDADPDDDDE